MAAPLHLVDPYIYPTLSLSTVSLSNKKEFYNLLIKYITGRIYHFSFYSSCYHTPLTRLSDGNWL